MGKWRGLTPKKNEFAKLTLASLMLSGSPHVPSGPIC